MSFSGEAAAAPVKFTTSSSDTKASLEIWPGKKLQLTITAPNLKSTKAEFESSSSSFTPTPKSPSSSSESDQSFPPPSSPLPHPSESVVIQIHQDPGPSAIPSASLSQVEQKRQKIRRKIEQISKVLFLGVGISMAAGLMFSNSPVVEKTGTLVAAVTLHFTFLSLLFGLFLPRESKCSFLLQLLGIGLAILSLSASGFGFLGDKPLKWIPVNTGVVGEVFLVIYAMPVLKYMI